MEDLHEPEQAQNTEAVVAEETAEKDQLPSKPEVESTQSEENSNPEDSIEEQELPMEYPAQAAESLQTNENEEKESLVEPQEVQKEDISIEYPENEVRLEEENMNISGSIKEAKTERKEQEEAEEEVKLADDFYDGLNKEEVVKTLEDVVSNPDIVKIKGQVSLLKIRFLLLNKEDKEQHFQTFLSEDGNKEDYVYEADPLEDRFNKAFEKYKANKARYAEELEQSKLANLAKKNALLDELKILVESTDSLKQIYDRFKDVQNTWKEIGAVPQANVAELWQNYHFYVEKFFDKIRINRELRDLDYKKNLEVKLEICEKAEALLLEPSILESFKLLQQYHQEWKDSGPVEDEKKDELWNRFKTVSDKINQNRRDYYEQLNKEQEENYKAKLAICEKIEEITNVKLESLKQANDINNAVNELFKTWKSLGAAPIKVHNEIWERFRKCMDDFFATKKQFLTQLNEDQVNNYNMKVNLCIRAEAIALRKDWKKAMADLLHLQEEWKNIGSVSHKQSEAIWKRFRKACDDFFAAKNEYFNNVEKHESENLAKKEALLKRINEFEFSESKEDNFTALKNFQREWTEIGFTPTAEKDRLWEAFRTAISKKFDDLKTFINSEDPKKYAQRISEMVSKESSKAKDFLAKEASTLQAKIKQLTDEANLWENNLGFFANSKNSELLKEQFGKKIENARQEIAALQEKLTILREKKR